MDAPRNTYLMCNVRTSFADISICPAHDTDMFIAVQEGILFVTAETVAASVRGSIRFEARIREDDDQTLGLHVSRGYGDMLLGNKLREFRRRARLCSWTQSTYL